ncbi:hemerythrin domain-containing protein [Nonomuraea sp. NEAU-A123]|uniref:hemerythrin domain-containing protein n=1 Tax=Nonomuraea sp. NEAU-A123 TaxID=2839649 RepID=UPI001BE4212D|nr:hemerythrin domain-containing protein [Nonomuraea sp. NEAU-A123]MBT2227016.1 hemerythrin domain-containing protein [Nonomuraea sp. NEAU-A123]
MNPPSEPDGRLTAFGNQLIEAHLWLREELARLREEVHAHPDAHTRPERTWELRAHCLTFCSAVTKHHSGEDEGAFPALAEQFPELRPVLDELARDHRQVADIMRALQELLGDLDADPERVRAELDGLAALLESHFVYEEKRLVSALNALDAPRWRASVPAFLSRTPLA